MLNINDLESRWFKYKLKSYFPYIIVIISVVLLVLVIQFIQIGTSEITAEKNNTHKIENLLTDQNLITTKKHAVQITTEPVINSKQDDNYKDKKTLLSPSLKFIDNIQKDSIINYKLTTVEKKPSNQITLKSQQNIIPKEIKKAIEQTPVIDTQPKVTAPKPQENYKINITRQTTHDDINDVIKRFNKNNNPALSLFIAKKYYEIGDYHKAYNYSLITNNINNDIEASWILFAKSLMKLDEKNMAIQTLNKYIKHSNSNRAKLLLDKILSGKFQ